ncbi:uncharacterized protein STEHIDRAFT_148414, partial [Stereum hirsutum FP-91666 SS1]|uniref:uncharacterized protein n=1 Tax=Stereum hirsutum (strain FP-91666) TaxID=721885 RepID=UPI0004449499
GIDRSRRLSGLGAGSRRQRGEGDRDRWLVCRIPFGVGWRDEFPRLCGGTYLGSSSESRTAKAVSTVRDPIPVVLPRVSSA